MALKMHETWSLLCVCFKFYCCITWRPCSRSKTLRVCHSSFLAFSFSCPPKATRSSGTHLKSTKKEMLSFRKCRMFLNITLFSSGLFCYPKGVMWYVDLMLLCCVCVGVYWCWQGAQFPPACEKQNLSIHQLIINELSNFQCIFNHCIAFVCIYLKHDTAAVVHNISFLYSVHLSTSWQHHC